MAIYYLFSVKLFSDYNYNITTLKKKKLKKICGRVCDCVYLITLKEMLYTYIPMFMRQAFLKKLLWIPKKKREIMRKRKKKSLGIRVLFSVFFPHEAI